MLTVFALNFRDDSARLDEFIERAARAERVTEREAEAATRLRADNERLRQRLARAAIALQRELQDREEVRAGLLQRLARGLESRGIRFALDQQSGVLRLSEEVPFATSRSDLTDRTRHTLQALAEVLASTLPCFVQAIRPEGCNANDAPILEAVLVEGHTDRQAYGGMTLAQSQQLNDQLSTARALAASASR